MGPDTLAIQSLFFEFGSEQAIHRDPIVVPTGAHGHLLAAWIALEEIGPDCGPLVYVPRSHHLPYYEFSPGEYRFDGSRMGAAEAKAAMSWFDGQCDQFGLAARPFTAKRGDVLFWHASLAHGGAPVADPAKTRKSFVVHFSTAATYPKRDIRLTDDDRGGVWETREILVRSGSRGYQNPALGAPAAASPS
jgi:ectoine hydroxylase-related dioxygenase (phytanoyl-CoA dioxygenase family)